MAIDESTEDGRPRRAGPLLFDPAPFEIAARLKEERARSDEAEQEIAGIGSARGTPVQRETGERAVTPASAPDALYLSLRREIDAVDSLANVADIRRRIGETAVGAVDALSRGARERLLTHLDLQEVLILARLDASLDQPQDVARAVRDIADRYDRGIIGDLECLAELGAVQETLDEVPST